MMPGMVDDAMWILEKADAESVLLPSGTESLDVNVSYSCGSVLSKLVSFARHSMTCILPAAAKDDTTPVMFMIFGRW